MRRRHLILGLLLPLLLLTGGIPLQAAATTVQYDYPGTGVTPTDVQAWQPILFVNGQPFLLGQPTCTTAAVVITCSVAAPDYAGALTTTGTQVFELVLRDTVLGVDSAKSAPFTRQRPGASSPPRLR